MEIRQLRYLVALAEERHFTRAAARANVAQPALSRQIRSLEVELGVPLVDRTSRRVSLTDAGERLVERARRILDELEAARADAQDLRQLLRGRVRFGVSATPGPVDVVALVAAFHRSHPGVELDVRDALSLELARRLRADTLDVALLTAVGEDDRRQLELLLVDEERLVLCVGSGHPLAARKRVALRDLRTERFAVFPVGATIRTLVERAAAEAGFEPQVAFEFSNTARMRALVVEGLAVAILPASQAGAPGEGTVAVGLAERSLVHQVFLGRRRDRELSPAARAFMATSRAHLEV
ncbi:MAG TPA: LysR substrate-binding domain-containing protein [Baekduia sp.]|uniref:LysR family transcriptional regulator n=1 Tax=Baekduia sp. TaxID=2600305 RepID=UPI002CB223F5|nr:LysR substrate-binding domain-containing protein [Baekduia sp.]HMJ34485.1 LysR substrate-binding domain-containing protein [Baekduia sp.]